MTFFHHSAPAATRFSFGRRARHLALAGLLSLLGGQVQAQETDTTFVRLLRQNTFALTADGSQLSGPGWDKIQQDVRQSALVLLGEDHGTTQIPAFATAVAQVLKPAVYVAEIDSYQAQDLTRLTAQPSLPTAYHQQHPLGLSFYSWAEEFALARTLRAQNVPIIGIDQASIVGTGRLFEQMAEQAKGKAAKAYLRSRAAVYQAQDRAAMSPKGGPFSIYQRPATLDSLRAITRQEGPGVQQMVRDLALSSEIFTLGNTQGLKSHQTRINLMKRNLLAGLQPYDKPGQPLPNMLFKFGAMHTGRSASLLGGVHDIGNLALNLADAHDQKSLHVFVTGKQGTKSGPGGPGQYSSATNTTLRPFMAATPNAGSWQVFDLRPLRRALLNEKLNVSTQTLATVLLNYDYVVIIPETTASKAF